MQRVQCERRLVAVRRVEAVQCRRGSEASRVGCAAEPDRQKVRAGSVAAAAREPAPRRRTLLLLPFLHPHLSAQTIQSGAPSLLPPLFNPHTRLSMSYGGYGAPPRPYLPRLCCSSSLLLSLARRRRRRRLRRRRRWLRRWWWWLRRRRRRWLRWRRLRCVPSHPDPAFPGKLELGGTARVAQLGAACSCTDSSLPLAPLLQAAAVLAASAAADSAVAATAVRCSTSSRAPSLGSRTDAPLPSQ